MDEVKERVPKPGIKREGQRDPNVLKKGQTAASREANRKKTENNVRTTLTYTCSVGVDLTTPRTFLRKLGYSKARMVTSVDAFPFVDSDFVAGIDARPAFCKTALKVWKKNVPRVLLPNNPALVSQARCACGEAGSCRSRVQCAPWLLLLAASACSVRAEEQFTGGRPLENKRLPTTA